MNRNLVLGAVLAGALAVPAAASAASVTLAKPCVRNDDSVGITLAGFQPGSFVRVLSDSDLIDAVQVGDDGGFSGAFKAPGNGDLIKRATTITATDDMGLTATASLTVTDVQVGMSPGKAKTTSKVRFQALGFVGDIGKPLYAHYTYAKVSTAHKLVKTVKLGTIQGPCGSLTTAKLTQLPLKKPKSGPYVIQFDANPTFKLQQGDYVERSLFVYPKRKN
jgi:hypothetical protein